MKQFIILLAVVALVSAAPEPKEKAEKAEKAQPAKDDNKQQAPPAAAPAEDKKPIEISNEKEEKREGLEWPLPDPMCEGDLILHGVHMFDRVRELHKSKLEDEVDKMILSHGRQFLRRVAKYLDDTPDFKIMPILCRDSRTLNSTIRWRIEIPRELPTPEPSKAPLARDEPIPKDKPAVDESKDNVTSNETEPVTEQPQGPLADKETYETRRRDFYKQVGTNFGRLLMKEYRKEHLIADEIEYLARWVNDEAVHYGVFGVYCTEGENVKEIKKQLVTFLEEKP